MIERCLQLYMNRDEVVKTLLNRARIDPGFTTLGNHCKRLQFPRYIYFVFFTILPHSILSFRAVQSSLDRKSMHVEVVCLFFILMIQIVLRVLTVSLIPMGC